MHGVYHAVLRRSLGAFAALMRELAAFTVRVTSRGHDVYEGSGEHDDLVVATALAVWAVGDVSCRLPDLIRGG